MPIDRRRFQLRSRPEVETKPWKVIRVSELFDRYFKEDRAKEMKTEETQDMLFRIVLISMLVGTAILIANIQVMGDIVPIEIMLSFLCTLLFLIICIVTDIDQIFSLFILEKIRSYMELKV